MSSGYRSYLSKSKTVEIEGEKRVIVGSTIFPAEITNVEDKSISSGQAQVFKGKYKHYSGKVAIKKFNNPVEYKEETDMYDKISHKNVLQVLRYYNSDCILVTPWMEKGNVEDYIEKTCPPPSLQDKLKILYGAALGIEYLHSNNILHLDLKPQNIFLDDKNNALIADFGLAIDKSKLKNSIISGTPGTTWFMAPEVMESKVKKESDIFSFRVVIWYMLAKGYPYQEYGDNQLKIREAVLKKKERPEIEDSWPYELKLLMEDCWNHDYSKRPNIGQVLLRLKAMMK